MAQPYDQKKDEYYHPDNTPDLYLTKKQVELTLKKVGIPDDPAEKEAHSVIRQIESLHRDYCLKKISYKDCLFQSDSLSEKFVKKFGFWHSETNTFKLFYKHFGN